MQQEMTQNKFNIVTQHCFVTKIHLIIGATMSEPSSPTPQNTSSQGKRVVDTEQNSGPQTLLS